MEKKECVRAQEGSSRICWSQTDFILFHVCLLLWYCDNEHNDFYLSLLKQDSMVLFSQLFTLTDLS